MRNRILFIVIALVLIIGVSLGIIIAVNRSPRLQNVVYKVAQTSENTNTVAPTTNTTPAQPQTSPDQQAIQYVARNFTERYGSFSNQNTGSNLLEAAQYATASYAENLQKQAANKQSSPAATEYNGVVTKALVFTFIKQGSVSASVVVSTQQTVTTGTITTVVTKDLLVDFTKVGPDWKVNAAVWK